ncbi:MAG: hypothetical protein ACK5Q2_12220, partial [Bacteroidota bacterium]
MAKVSRRWGLGKMVFVGGLPTEFHLWPNPASHEVLLELPACASGSIQVLDVMSCWVQDIIVQGGGS